MSGAGARALVERPILFSGPMVRAILDGKKTQTRRLVKGAPCGPEAYLLGVHKGVWGIHADVNQDDGVWRGRCPYGRPGNRLWVRETWMPFHRRHTPPAFAYKADTDSEGDEIRREYIKIGYDYRWRPSIHMPRAASRLLLEVVEVRVERLQDISQEDAIAEGMQCPGIPAAMSDRGAFAKLWEDINGKRAPWASNPWVWKVTFRKVEEGDVSRGGAEALSEEGGR